MANEVRLINLHYREVLRGTAVLELRNAPIAEFNLVLGDNAQGKSRFFNLLRYLKEIHTVGVPSFPNGEQYSFSLNFSQGNAKIQYDLDVTPHADGVTPIYNETITKDGLVLFSRSKKKLLDEGAGNDVPNFFMPPNTPALRSLASERQFPTISTIRSFLERMMFLEANRLNSSNISIEKGVPVMRYRGENASTVLETWKQLFPEAYAEVVSEFEEIFSTVSQKSVRVENKILPGINVPAPLLSFTDKESGREIIQKDWSDGLLRTICLLILPAHRFPKPSGSFLRPSLVFVDEIENGLDFDTLSKVMGFYESYSTHMQVIVSSHSPTICNLISPERWRISKRTGSVIEILSPEDVEGNLEEQRKKLLKDNWEFYRRHIARSKLYAVH